MVKRMKVLDLPSYYVKKVIFIRNIGVISELKTDLNDDLIKMSNELRV